MNTFAFIAKKLISAMIYPLGISLLFLFTALFYLGDLKNRRTRVLIFFPAIILLIFSTPLLELFLIGSLEKNYHYARPDLLKEQGIDTIVVLGAQTVTNDGTPADMWGKALPRVMEGVRLFTETPGRILILSGGSGPGKQSEEEAMAILPMSLGVPRENMILETRAWDTKSEAILFRPSVKNAPFALVTSAFHMPRSIRTFEKIGLKPVPCPCSFLSNDTPPWYMYPVPNARSLYHSTLAIHEYLGLVWLHIVR